MSYAVNNVLRCLFRVCCAEQQNWRDVIPQSEDVLDFVVNCNEDKLVAVYMHHVKHELKVCCVVSCCVGCVVF